MYTQNWPGSIEQHYKAMHMLTK